MKNVIYVLTVAFGVLMVWVMVTDDGSAPTTTAASAPTFNVDTSASAQDVRLEALQGLKDDGYLHKIEGQRLYVGPRWNQTTIDQKQTIAEAVFSVLYTNDESISYMPIYSGQSGEKIASFGEWGYRSD